MLVHISKIIREAERGNYALGAFNTSNLEITLGIIKGACRSGSPIIIQFTPSTMKYARTEILASLIKKAAEHQGKKIDIALHLDHGRTYQDVKECIQSGFSSVMIDASDKNFSQNVSLTKKVVKYAHSKNVWVQAELGRVEKGKKGYQRLITTPEEFLTDPDQAQEFVKKTQVDTLAVAIGNIHGPYKIKQGVPRLMVSHLREIQKKVKIPFVLHGASGVSLAQLKKAVSFGVRIINIDTEIRMAFKTGLEVSLQKEDEYDPRKILTPAIENIAKVVAKKTRFLSQPR